MTWIGFVRPLGFWRIACTAVWARLTVANGPSVLFELGAGSVPLHESLPSGAIKKSAVALWPDCDFTVYCWLALCCGEEESVIFTVSGKLPVCWVVPETTPVPAFKEMPDGKLPLERLQ